AAASRTECGRGGRRRCRGCRAGARSRSGLALRSAFRSGSWPYLQGVEMVVGAARVEPAAIEGDVVDGAAGDEAPQAFAVDRVDRVEVAVVAAEIDHSVGRGRGGEHPVAGFEAPAF